MRRNLAIGCRCLNDDYPRPKFAKIRAQKDVAFRTVARTLKLWFADRAKNAFSFHAEDLPPA